MQGDAKDLDILFLCSYVYSLFCFACFYLWLDAVKFASITEAKITELFFHGSLYGETVGRCLPHAQTTNDQIIYKGEQAASDFFLNFWLLNRQIDKKMKNNNNKNAREYIHRILFLSAHGRRSVCFRCWICMLQTKQYNKNKKKNN